ncbi:hypothetical protein GIB67_036027 [Kingdonia uniflora]|uniref:Pentatricopeptide repeat-containing protein n=1 Tax=Kingdonia uniflora TaxID=39325 RepID=A0A7J7N116_9MAGN|nr:hypothetical protein GIB67_036027 [Kingdonia uniflora]
MQLRNEMVERDFSLDANNTSIIVDLHASDGPDSKLTRTFDKIVSKRQREVQAHSDRTGLAWLNPGDSAAEFSCTFGEASTIFKKRLRASLLGSAKKLDEAMHTFEDMYSNGLTPDVITYNSLIDGLCEIGRVATAQELFMEMQARGPSPNMENGVLKADIVTYSTVIDNMCKSNNVDEAKKLFDSLPSKNLKCDTMLFNILIRGLLTEGLLQESEDLFAKMLDKGPTPDELTYNTMFRDCSRITNSTKQCNFGMKWWRGTSLSMQIHIYYSYLHASDGPDSKLTGTYDKIVSKCQREGIVTAVELDV